MKNILLFIAFLLIQKVNAQTVNIKSSISSFIISKYKTDSFGYTHTVDTIMKLKNGNYFVMVKNENQTENIYPGTYDQYEVSSGEDLQIQKSILGTGLKDNVGDCEMEYHLYYLDKQNYVVIAFRTIVSHGSYNSMSIIINANYKCFEASLLWDSYGMIHSQYKDFVTVKTQNQFLKEINFKTKKTEIIGDKELFRLKEKSYKVLSNDFNTDLNCIMLIKPIQQRIILIK